MNSFYFASRFSDVNISVVYEGNILVGKLEIITTVMNIKVFYFFVVVVPCILITLKFLSPTNAPFY